MSITYNRPVTKGTTYAMQVTPDGDGWRVVVTGVDIGGHSYVEFDVRASHVSLEAISMGGADTTRLVLHGGKE